VVFSSLLFLFLFLPLALAFYFGMPAKGRNYVLLLFSFLFYAWGETRFLWIMIISICANWALGIGIGKFRNKDRFILILGIIFNLSLLVYFKYFDFFIESFKIDSHAISFLYLPEIYLPLGISFFTFHSLSYIIDVYRKQVQPQINLFDLALYISIFPQLVAGPILRYHDLAPQLSSRIHSIDLFSSGVKRFAVGLAKKVLIANVVGRYADLIFNSSGSDLPVLSAWIGVLCYTIQIYFDFSGYSDMAIGLGRMFGFRFLENFNFPYSAKSIKDFWRRWHISLSTWFRDYLYIPLGGNKTKAGRSYFNLILVFFLCGLWHGASWNFIVWGLFHGLFLILERGWWGRIVEKTPVLIQRAYTLLVVIIGWVFFRTENLGQATRFLKSMFLFDSVSFKLDYRIQNPEIIIYLLIGLGSIIFINSESYKKVRSTFEKSTVLQGCVILMLLGLSSLSLAGGTYNPFIYFRF